MNASIIPLRPAPPDPLAELHAERARLGKELDRFTVVDQRQAAAAAKIAEIDAALGALDRADREAVEAWAAAAEGEPPAPLLDERKALLARRLDAEAGRQAAEIAVAAVAAKRTALIHQMNAMDLKIRERQIAGVLDEGRRVHGEAEALAASIVGKLMRVMGLRQAIVSLMSEAANRNDANQARIFNGALAEIDALKRPDLLADPATVDRFATEWREALR